MQLLRNLYDYAYFWIFPKHQNEIDQVAPCVDPKPLDGREMIREPSLAELKLRIHYGKTMKSE